MGLRGRLSKLIAPSDGATESRSRANDPLKKQEAERRAELDPRLRRTIDTYDLLPKPYDPKTLRDFAENPIAQAYIDTLAQDAATADWSLEPRDETVTVSQREIEDGVRTIKSLHPEMSFRDLREFASRDLLELGDATWVKHFTSSGELAEAVPVNAARLYRKVDDHGFTEGYAQASFANFDVDVEYDLNEVVWFTWAQGGRNTYQYGYGPVEKGKPIIELLDELSKKELKDLKQGAPPGILSAREDADNPVPPEEFDRVDEQWELREGERHRSIVSRGDWEYVPLSPGYDDLQLLQRSKFWIHSLGGVFKVNAPYAGFDFQEGNQAQNESQAEAFRQRGFRVMLRYLRASLNKQLVWPHINEDLQFVFEEARTNEERKEVAELRQAQATAGQKLADAGLSVSFSDGRLQVEDGEMEAGSEAGGDDGGGMFSADDSGVEREGDAGDGDYLSLQKTIEMDEWLMQAYEEQIQPRTASDIEKRSWSGDESVPEFVREKVSEVIDGGAIFDQFDSLPGDVRDTVEGLFEENLTQPQGWSLDSLVSDFKDVFPGVDTDQIETVCRTESASVLNAAREEGYQERPDSARFTFYWQGVSDSRQTDFCKAIKKATNPQHGGEPVKLVELKRRAEELHREHFPSLSFRGIEAAHPNCRHTFVRSVNV